MLRNYLKMALRVLARRKFFTFISLFGISITLLVLLVATAMLDHIFAPQPPEPHADRMLGIYQIALKGEGITFQGNAGYGLLDQIASGLREEVPAIEEISIFSTTDTVISYVGGRKIESSLKRTDGAFWKILDFDFVEGGPFSQDDEANARFVAVISETTRARFFGGGPALGRSFEADGQRFRVVGVVRDVPMLRLVPFAEIWVPISTTKSKTFRKEYFGDFMAVFLARSGSDFPTIKAGIDRRFRLAEKHIPDPMFTSVRGGADTLFEAASRLLFSSGRGREDGSRPELLWALLITLAFLFMLLPSVNLVNINLSRILDRASEIGVRKAFGASSRSLVGQFVIENVVLTLIGSAIGLILAAAVLAGLNASGLIPYADLRLNFRVFFEGLALALFFGLFSGVYPAWKMSRLHPVQALRGRTA
ncbi:MAG TPA: ABC transporter permease [Thermoanaerobaculia bacterium]|nr:ABC transporter permease [Thermoanaerobaculia bacterium]